MYMRVVGYKSHLRQAGGSMGMFCCVVLLTNSIRHNVMC